MGRQDIIIKNWLQNPQRFADLFNAIFFDGHLIIRPEDLTPFEREIDMIYKDKTHRSHALRRHRDLSMVWKEAFELAIITMEIQNKIHYSMPVRCMLQDSMTYTEQIKKSWRVKKKEDIAALSSDEFLARFSRNDHIIPILTIVFYYADNKWDGPTDLHSMFPSSDEPFINDILKKIIPNYHLNLLDINEFSGSDLLHTDLLFAFNLVKLKKDKQAFYKYLMEHKHYFQHVDEETAYALGALLHSEALAKKISNEQGMGLDHHKKEDINMCQALEELLEDSRLEGITLGKQEGIMLGKQEGLMLGKQEGINEGRRHTAIDIAKKMMKEGLSGDLIARITGLSTDQLKSL